MMLAELQTLLDTVPAESDFGQFQQAVVDDNLLGKATESNRKGTLRRLRELYALDSSVPLFHVFRKLWDLDEASQPLLAAIVAYARDPLFRSTAGAVLATPGGAEIIRQSVTEAIDRFSDGGMSDSTIDKVARNTSSTWSQAGHLVGRVRKIRTPVQATPTTVTLAMLLAFANGHRGKALLSNEFIALLDADAETARARAIDARRLGLIDLRETDGVFDVGFLPLLTQREWRILNGAN
ncbi:hypothetical protein SH139x_001910 [Planctomycetaceae bacterium SH139]